MNVPEIYAYDETRGLMLLEDFGHCCFFDQLTQENANALYQEALASLLKLQTTVNIVAVALPEYDADFFKRELSIFYEWFLTAFL